MSKQEVWDDTISFYRNLEDESDLATLQSLVESITRTDYSKVLYPSTSHHDLCISTVGGYVIKLVSAESFGTPVCQLKVLRKRKGPSSG